MEDDEWAVEDLPAARELVETVDGAELFIYPGDGHLFADNSLPDYDEAAATLLQQRVLVPGARVMRFALRTAGEVATTTAHGDEVTERVVQVFAQRDDQAPRAARRLVDRFDDLDDDLRSNLVIVVSELVANAVRHAPVVDGGEVRLVIAASSDRVRVEVSDPGHGFDPTPVANDLGGLGLTIVGKVAGTWGIETDPARSSGATFPGDVSAEPRVHHDVLLVAARGGVEATAAGDEPQPVRGRGAEHGPPWQGALGVAADGGDAVSQRLAGGQGEVDDVALAGMADAVEHRRAGGSVDVAREHGAARCPGRAPPDHQPTRRGSAGTRSRRPDAMSMRCSRPLTPRRGSRTVIVSTRLRVPRRARASRVVASPAACSSPASGDDGRQTDGTLRPSPYPVATEPAGSTLLASSCAGGVGPGAGIGTPPPPSGGVGGIGGIGGVGRSSAWLVNVQVTRGTRRVRRMVTPPAVRPATTPSDR